MLPFLWFLSFSIYSPYFEDFNIYPSTWGTSWIFRRGTWDSIFVLSFPLVNKAWFYHLRSRDGTPLVEEPSRGIMGNYAFGDGWKNLYVFVKIQEHVGYPTSWRTVGKFFRLFEPCVSPFLSGFIFYWRLVLAIRCVSSSFLCWRSGSKAYNRSSSAILMGDFSGEQRGLAEVILSLLIFTR